MLLVSSTTLSNASKYFATLFGPRFSEGQDQRSPDNPKQIRLPEDEPQAMLDLCMVLQGRRTDFSNAVPPLTTRILQLAVVVDKYQCAEILHLQNKAILLAWLNHWKITSFEQHGDILAASYLLRQARSFIEVTKRMILEHHETYSGLHDVIPTSVLCGSEII